MRNLKRTDQLVAATGAISFLSGNPASFFALSQEMQFLSLFGFINSNFVNKTKKLIDLL